MLWQFGLGAFVFVAFAVVVVFVAFAVVVVVDGVTAGRSIVGVAVAVFGYLLTAAVNAVVLRSGVRRAAPLLDPERRIAGFDERDAG